MKKLRPGSVLTSRAGSGSVLRPVRMRNAAYMLELLLLEAQAVREGGQVQRVRRYGFVRHQVQAGYLNNHFLSLEKRVKSEIPKEKFK